MEEALKNFIKTGRELSYNWDNDYPTLQGMTKYPEYLPSFDEFVEDFSLILEDS